MKIVFSQNKLVSFTETVLRLTIQTDLIQYEKNHSGFYSVSFYDAVRTAS